MMKKWNLIIDIAKCHNCNNCVLAAKDEYVGNEFPGYSAPHSAHGGGVIQIRRKVRGSGSMLDVAYLPVLCNHCDDAPCIKAGQGAVIKRDDGIVIIDPEKAKGRKDLVASCPYEVIVWNEELQLPQAWGFDAHLLDSGWNMPRCVQSCPTGAIQAFNITDQQMRAHVEQENLSSLYPETRPRVHYRNLYRFQSCFIGGAVVMQQDDLVDCVEGAGVRLLREDKLLAETQTDVFGEFRFDGLSPNTGSYVVQVSHSSYGHSSVTADVAQDSINLGELVLTG